MRVGLKSSRTPDRLDDPLASGFAIETTNTFERGVTLTVRPSTTAWTDEMSNSIFWTMAPVGRVADAIVLLSFTRLRRSTVPEALTWSQDELPLTYFT